MAAQNPNKKPALPRLTVKELHDIVTRHIEGCNLRIDELEKLGLSRKTPGIAKEVTRLHRMVADIKSEVGRMRLDDDNVFTNERNRLKLEEIINDRLMELNNSIAEEFSAVNERIDHVEDKVDTLGDAHNKLNSSHQRLTGHVNDIKVFIDTSSRFPWGRAVIAAVIGIIAGVLWNIYDFSQVVKISDGNNVTVPDWRNDLWVAYLFGALVAGTVFGILAMFSRKTSSPDRPMASDYRTAEDATYVKPVPRNPEPITHSLGDEDGTAPTKPIPAQGAPVGTP